MNPEGLLRQALAFHQSGNLVEAERLYLHLMQTAPLAANTPHLLGVLRAQQGRNLEALALMDQALALNADAPEVLANQANVLRAEDRLSEALTGYDKALVLKPDYVMALSNKALVLRDLGRLEEALASSQRALEIKPNHIDAWNAQGIILADLNRHDEALASYDRALAYAPDFPDVLSNRALTLKAIKRLDEALASVDQALRLNQAFAEAWNNRGVVLFDLKRMGEALASYDQALALRPYYAQAFNNRAVALWSLKRFSDSLADCDKALAIKPGFADAHYNRGNALCELNRPAEALASYEKALAIEPTHPNALSGLANAALLIGDWDRTAQLAGRLKEDVLLGRSVIQPFVMMGYWDDNELQLRCARNYVLKAGPGPVRALWNGERYRHDKIRIAYLSADYHQHVTAALTVEMFERHDRDQFELTAVSFGPEDNSAMRQRLIKAFDRFHDGRQQSDHAIAELIRQWEIDIAVDLGGHTSGARPWVLAHRPAPVQAKYMGYPGTSGSDFIDYIVADRMVVPPDQDRFFSEKIAALPETLWVTDTRREMAKAPSRTDVGLGEGFVFCCFNHNWKITPDFFDVWMRLLGKVEGSVLWLLEGNKTIADNLRRHAQARGVSPARLIFASRTTPELHLARQSVADLFLDTLPYNAHTTASDALWVGLPVLTTPGHSFPARVAASILKAADLEELIAPDLATYEHLAVELASNSGALKAIRQKLTASRDQAPLFDTARFMRHLQQAYRTMLERA
jgi:protein O-GlcNAc transferase